MARMSRSILMILLACLSAQCAAVSIQKRGRVDFNHRNIIDDEINSALIESGRNMDVNGGSLNYYNYYENLMKDARHHPNLLPAGLGYFNQVFSKKLHSKEAWLQSLAMSVVYSDVFTDTVPRGTGYWELNNFSSESLLQPHLNVKNDLAESYILKEDEWGKGGKESIGMKAQLWTPKYPLQSGRNIIVFRGTALSSTFYNRKKKIGNGFHMDFEKDGIGKESFEIFYPRFKEWVSLSKRQSRGVTITGHSLGGVLSMRLLAKLMSEDKTWAKKNAEAFVFNAPGLDDATAASLDEAKGLYLIRNKGDFFPHFHQHPELDHLYIHSILNRNDVSFIDSIRLHNYIGLAALESKGVRIKIQPYEILKDDLRDTLSHFEHIRQEPIRRSSPSNSIDQEEKLLKFPWKKGTPHGILQSNANLHQANILQPIPVKSLPHPRKPPRKPQNVKALAPSVKALKNTQKVLAFKGFRP